MPAALFAFPQPPPWLSSNPTWHIDARTPPAGANLQARIPTCRAGAAHPPRSPAMFGWKRQRKEEAVECAVLPPSTPAALVDAAVLPRGSSPSCVSSSEQMAEPASATQLPMPSSSGRGDGLELAAVGAGQRQPLERGSVRSKAAYFEALMRRRAAGGGGSSVDGSGGGQQADADMRHADSSSSSDDDAAEHWQGCPGAHCSAHDATAAGPSHGSGSAGSGGGSMSGRQHGSPEEMAALIEQLQGALDLKERQRKAAAEALARRVSGPGGLARRRAPGTQGQHRAPAPPASQYTAPAPAPTPPLQTSECENLMRVVRELAQSRTKAVSQRASLAERYGELQQEYSRMLRIADLSRTVRCAGGVAGLISRSSGTLHGAEAMQACCCCWHAQYPLCSLHATHCLPSSRPLTCAPAPPCPLSPPPRMQQGEFGQDQPHSLPAAAGAV